MFEARTRPVAWGVLALLAACTPAAPWSKQGADDEAVGRNYRECRELAGEALRTDRDIDQDITATRSRDWQRAHTLEQQQNTMRAMAADRADAIIERCMTNRGFSRQR